MTIIFISMSGYFFNSYKYKVGAFMYPQYALTASNVRPMLIAALHYKFHELRKEVFKQER